MLFRWFLIIGLCYWGFAIGCGQPKSTEPVKKKKQATVKEPGKVTPNPTGTSAKVNLRDEKVSLAEVAGRPDANRIEVLEAGHSKLMDEDLKVLPKFAALKSLELKVNSSLTDEGLKHIANLSQLESLSLFYCPLITGNGLEHLKSLKKLKKLDIGNNKLIKDEDLVHLQSLESLIELRCSPLLEMTDAGLKTIAQLESLQQLRIGSKKLTDDGLLALASLKNLKLLFLTKGSAITEEGMTKLKQALPQCKVIQ